ncbi:cytidine deaminase [Eubacteriales bacterium OttesenSCG-928-M02]|nr:cytidine deaminase [Eubacteriales bacterium OttesenSCG-928-M02]
MPFTTLLHRAKEVLQPRSLTANTHVASVAAALITVDGNIYTGVCIDTPSSLGCCAEHSAICAMITAGESHISHIVAVGEESIMPPCGRCRQLIRQVDDKNMDTLVLVKEGEAVPLKALLPYDYLDG